MGTALMRQESPSFMTGSSQGKYKHIGYFDTEAGAIEAVQANTSPSFPPVPDDGPSAMEGIETMSTADNLQA